MNWMAISLISAVVLGVYDIFKKQSVQNNAVIPVLFCSVLVSSLLWLTPTVLSLNGNLSDGALHVKMLDLRGHLELFAKSTLVGSSWICAYFALKNLPVSIVAPIRSSSPMWTLIGAVILLQERPNAGQWAGISITVISFIALSLAGRKDGIHFHKNKWIFILIAATLLGANSAIYDRYLLGIRNYDVPTVQAWFSHYLVIFMIPFMIGWYKRWWPRASFQWRASIPLISISLLAADYLYFTAMRDPDALVAIISSLRRTAAVIPFAAGYFIFKERNFRAKIPCVAGILAGVLLIVLSG